MLETEAWNSATFKFCIYVVGVVVLSLSGSAELSALVVTSSESSIVSSQSEREVEIKSSMPHVTAQKPNTTQDESLSNQKYEDPGQNTSDEDQDDLPYDGDLGSPYFNQTAISEGNSSSDGRKTVHASPDVPAENNTRNVDDVIESLVSVEHHPEKPTTLSPDDADTKQENFFDNSKPSDFAQSRPFPADINQLLLRHFSQEELLQSGRLIEAETLPEVSLLESMDDSVFSFASTHNRKAINCNHSESLASNSEIKQSFDSDRTDEKSSTVSKNSNLEKNTERKIDNVTSAATDSIKSSSEGSGNTSCIVAKAKEDDLVQRVPFVRTRSFNEMKYGQGQVHYPLPDFSKVAPKVKIPKVPSGPARPAPQSTSTMHRTQSSPGMLEVISRVLEDSVQPSEKPYVFKDTDKTPPELVHHLQVENI